MASREPNSADRSMDAALRRVLRSGQAPGPAGAPGAQQSRNPGCNAELAVAYVEGRLGRGERESFETHMVQCTGCRSLAAAMGEELLPAATEPAPARRGVRWGLSWRWAVPAMAGVVLVGSAVYYQREQVVRAPAKVAVAIPAAPEPAAEALAPARQVPHAVHDAISRSVRAKARQATSSAGAVVREEKEKDAELRAEPAPAPPAELPAQVGQASPPAPAAAVDLRKREAAKDSVAAAATGNRRDAVQEAAATTNLVAGPTNYAVASKALATTLPGGVPLRGLTEHDGRLWAISDGGRIFRSLDRGRTWTPIESPTTADLVRVNWDPQTEMIVVEDREGKRYSIKP